MQAKVNEAAEKAKAKSAGGQSGTFDSAAVLAEYPQFRFDALRKEFLVHAGRDYSKGDEVFIVYGVGWSPVEGHITDGGLGSRAHFAHHYGFLPTSTDAPHSQEEAEQIRISLEYILSHDQSACGGATQTGKVESWRRDLLQATGLSARDHVSFSSLDGSLGHGDEDLALLRLWTVCPDLRCTRDEGIAARDARQRDVGENNEVAVHWMLIRRWTPSARSSYSLGKTGRNCTR